MKINSTKKSVAVFALKIMLAGSSVFLTFLIGKFYGAQDLAEFAVLQSLAIVSSTIALVGTNESLVYYCSKYPAKSKYYFLSSVLSFLLFYSLLVLIAYSWLVYDGIFDRDEFVAWVFMTVPIGLLMLSSGFSRGKEYYYLGILLEPSMVSLLAFPVLSGLLFLNIKHEVIHIYIYCCWILLGLYISKSVWCRHRDGSEIINFGGVAEYFNYLKGSIKYSVFSVVGMATSYLTIIISSIYLSTFEVASLRVAQQLALIVGFSLILGNYLLPVRFLKLFEEGKIHALKKLAKQSSALMMLISILPFIVFCIFGKYIFEYLGAGAQAYYFLYLVLIGQMFNVGCGSVMTILKMSGKIEIASSISVLSSLAFIVILLISSRWGLSGVGVSILLFYLIQNSLAVLAVKKELGFYPVMLPGKSI